MIHPVGWGLAPTATYDAGRGPDRPDRIGCRDVVGGGKPPPYKGDEIIEYPVGAVQCAALASVSE